MLQKERATPLAPWQHDELFTSRYQWQSYGGYFDYREAYDGIKNAYKCDIGLWAEMRTIAGGGTSVVGSSGAPPTEWPTGALRGVEDGVRSPTFMLA